MSDTASYPARVLKKTLRMFLVIAALLCAASIGISQLFIEDVVVQAEQTSNENLRNLWKSYRESFIEGGRVFRPRRDVTNEPRPESDPAKVNDNDTVSEGQAYAMLRAAWMKDRATFDAVYKWTEDNLSRFKTYGDHLLAWRYKPGLLGDDGVFDANSAIDADLDYALALFLAAKLWPDGRAPSGVMPYRDKALAVAESVMRNAVLNHPAGLLVLLPWPLEEGRSPEVSLTINPSYFSPGHYRVFERESGDPRWGRLAADTYTLMNQMLDFFGGRGEQVATVPDWIVIRPDGRFAVDPERGYVSGWDAFRFWWRVRLDYDFSGYGPARDMIETRLTKFIEKSMRESNGEVASESGQDGTPINKWSNPGQTAAYFWTLRDFRGALSRSLQRQALRRLNRVGGQMYFQDPRDYYTNSWAWYAMTEGSNEFPFAGLYTINMRQSGSAAAQEAKP